MARRIAVILVALVVCSLPFAWFGAEIAHHDVWSASGKTMGTTYTMTVVSEWGRPWPEDVQPAVDAHLAQVNRWMSTYDPASELSRFNQSESTDWFQVSSETAKVVACALELAKDSSGAYDPTIGPVVNLWGFGPGGRRAVAPTDEEIAEAREHVGWQLVEARLDPPAIKKTDAAVYLDLSSIAKGFGVDEVSRVLFDVGVENSMVEIGGEVVCRGAKPGEHPWRIGVLSPTQETGELVQSVVELRDAAMATSGDYFNQFEAEGVRYSHTIDPKTGRPVTHTTTSVSVRAENCMTADALATALLVMGSGPGYDWAEKRGIAALFIDRVIADSPVADAPVVDSNVERFSEKTTPAWDAKGAIEP